MSELKEYDIHCVYNIKNLNNTIIDYRFSLSLGHQYPTLGMKDEPIEANGQLTWKCQKTLLH